MKYGFYAIKDKLSGVVTNGPTVLYNDAVALNGFCEFLKGEKIVRPECYEFVRLGDYDDVTLEISSNFYKIADGKNANEVLEDIIANQLGENE